MSAQTVIGPAKSSRELLGEEVERPSVKTRPPCANVLGVQVEALDMDSALLRVAETLQGNQKGYVCAIGVHGVMEAQRDAALAQVFAGAAITVPDGMPMVWVGRMQGHRSMQRVAGPDLMLEVFRRQEFASYSHFLYGGQPGVADELAAALRRQFPQAKIVGTYTPPFRDLSGREEQELIATIDACEPDIIWVGISAPRQEIFMHHYLQRLKTRLMFGVGAAFDFHTGRIQDSPPWIKRAGLQWLHRLIQEPRRLWRRYFRNNPAFLWRIALQLTGLRSYGAVQVAIGSARHVGSAKRKETKTSWTNRHSGKDYFKINKLASSLRRMADRTCSSAAPEDAELPLCQRSPDLQIPEVSAHGASDDPTRAA
jgi:N-acetylglucosaminyldiphosphoundecaprenol N-acetyl-beta-D-mannosaminyltransferase